MISVQDTTPYGKMNNTKKETAQYTKNQTKETRRNKKKQSKTQKYYKGKIK